MIGNLQKSEISILSPSFPEKNMPRLANSKEEAQRLKRERDRRYQSNSEVKAKKKERDRVYQQGKREQARLRGHQDPLAQLADIVTQQQYLEVEDGPTNESTLAELAERDEEGIDVCGIVEEDGDILENFDGGGWNEGVDDEFDFNMSDDGINS